MQPLTSIPTNEKPQQLQGGTILDCVLMEPRLLVADAKVTTATATVRLYRYNEEMGVWVPSAVAAVVLDPAVDGGVAELRFNTAAIPGYYALVRTAGTGTVSYQFRPGSN